MQFVVFRCYWGIMNPIEKADKALKDEQTRKFLIE